MSHERHILLVEDNPDDEALTIRALKKNRIMNEVVVAHDGVEAIEILFGAQGKPPRPGGLPQVVLLDLNMPRMSGLEVLERLRKDPLTRLLPVVMLTSSKEEEDIVRSYSLGANAYVRKPVEFDQFVEAVRTLGMFWLLLNETAPEMAGGRG
jgi:two-component system response regulator